MSHLQWGVGGWAGVITVQSACTHTHRMHGCYVIRSSLHKIVAFRQTKTPQVHRRRNYVFPIVFNFSIFGGLLKAS